MSTPLCPEGVPEIDADPPSLDAGCVEGMGTACPRPYPAWEGMPFPTFHRYYPPHFVGPGDVPEAVSHPHPVPTVLSPFPFPSPCYKIQFKVFQNRAIAVVFVKRVTQSFLH